MRRSVPTGDLANLTNLLLFAPGIPTTYRFDPVYSDAKARAQTLGEFNFFSAWMSQPKSQLETFRAWAGKDSDIRSVIRSCAFQGRGWNEVLTQFYAGTATTSHRTTLTYPAGSSRERRFQRGLWLVLLRASLQESRTTVFPRLRIPSHCSLTGSPSRAQGTAALPSIRPPGLLHRTRVFIPLNAGTIWQKRFAPHSRLPLPHLPFRARAAASQLTCPTSQGEINVDQAHRGYDVTVDDTGKTWYNPF